MSVKKKPPVDTRSFNKVIHLKVDDDTYRDLQEIAEAEERSVTNVTQRILRDSIERAKANAR